MIARPPRVFIRARKPWRRLRLTTLGWKVLFITSLDPRAKNGAEFTSLVEKKSIISCFPDTLGLLWIKNFFSKIVDKILLDFRMSYDKKISLPKTPVLAYIIYK